MKWIINLKVKYKTVKLLEDSKGESFCYLGLGKVFFDMMPKARSIEEKLDKLDIIQVKIFYSVKDTLKRMRGQVSQDWEKMYVNYKSDKVCVSRIYKALLKCTKEKRKE